LASMTVGAFAAIVQKNIKRLMAYSSIGHIGFIVLATAVGGAAGVTATIYYTALYLVMSAGAFAVILAVYDNEEGNEAIDKIAGLAKTHPVLAFSFAALLLSMAGIPPLAGFFAKLSVFQVALEADLTWVVVLGVLFSVVSAYYYLRIIKLMYFDAPLTEALVVVNTSKIWLGIAALSAALMVFLLVLPQPLANLAMWAAGTP
jgi:NADH-quinone oxidoreductase subunit N